MNAMETNLLVKADRMSESSLVSLGDWELAYLRMAMVNRVEDALNESLQDTDQDNRLGREAGGQSFSAEQPRPSGQGDREVFMETKG